MYRVLAVAILALMCACGDEEGKCGDTTCAADEVCCNASCGICTPPDGACIQLHCG